MWTLVSRFTGVLRGITIAAVLGATYFANTYQFTNSLPNLVFYGLLAGSMFSSLLVPALVGHIDSGDRRAAARTAGGLLGMALVGMLAIVPVVAVGDPLAAQARLERRRRARPRQVRRPPGPSWCCCCCRRCRCTRSSARRPRSRTLTAASRWRRPRPRWRTWARSPSSAWWPSSTPTWRRSSSVPLSLLLLLGLGTTGAVLLHASVQWWGARRAGIVLVPNAGWRDPQVRATIHRALPALGQAALAELQLGALFLAADRVPGGVVAFQLATNFYFLPIALAATPVALSLVPRLSRMTAPGQAALFRDTYVRGLAFACFFAVPAATAYAVLAGPIAGMIGFGAFGAAGGRELDRGGTAGPGAGHHRRDAVPGDARTPATRARTPAIRCAG